MLGKICIDIRQDMPEFILERFMNEIENFIKEKFSGEFNLETTEISGKTGIKHDKNKIRYDLLPFESIEEILQVLEYGCNKYGKNNWQKIENADERLWNAAMRHLISAKNDISAQDQETGFSHLSHCAANLLFLLWFARQK